MNKEQLIDLILEKFPEWNDQITLDRYDVVGLISIFVSAGFLKELK